MALLKKAFFKEKEKNILNKSIFFCFWLPRFFLSLKAKFQTQLVERAKFKRHPLTVKAFNSPEQIYNKFNTCEN